MTTKPPRTISLKSSLIMLCLTVMLSLTAGCGFHLKGVVALPGPLQTLSISAMDNRPELAKVLRQALLNAGVTISPNAPFDITIDDEIFSRRVTIVDANAKASEYELRVILIFSLHNQDGTTVIDKQRVEVIKNYTYALEQVSGKQREEAILRSEMREEAVSRMLRQFQFLSL
ncbi:MAG: hypothetical protein COB04_18865 [Gammaproteobacteria bacterium]|nr:MAG: hypothetical protein COB04_18865 [Gammaproteobacteria bacterium]